MEGGSNYIWLMIVPIIRSVVFAGNSTMGSNIRPSLQVNLLVIEREGVGGQVAQVTMPNMPVRVDIRHHLRPRLCHHQSCFPVHPQDASSSANCSASGGFFVHAMVETKAEALVYGVCATNKT